MALPTAQLGQMSNINVPSYVPLTVVPKKQSVWEQALASFLVNMAGQAGGQAVQNVMAKDTAAPDAQAGFFKKLVGGPTQTVAENQAALGRAQQEKLAAKGDQSAMARLLEGERGANLRTSLGLREQANQGELNRGQTMSIEQARIARDREQQVAQIQARMAEIAQQFEGQGGLESLRNTLSQPLTQSQIVENQARTGLLNSQSNENAMLLERMRRAGAGQGTTPTTGSTGATDAVRQAALQAMQSSGGSPTPSTNPARLTYEEFLAQLGQQMVDQSPQDNIPPTTFLEKLKRFVDPGYAVQR
jgi:hypothetical protein